MNIKDTIDFNEGISSLNRYSLIYATDTMLSIHRLLQVVIIDQLNENRKAQWCEGIHNLFKAEFPGDPWDDIDSWSLCDELITHALHITEYSEYLQDQTILPCLLNAMAVYLHRTGSYKEAEPLYRRALEICEKKFGPDHPTTITIRKNYQSFISEMKQEGK